MIAASDKEMSLAHVYARAMLDLALASGEADTMLRELSELAAYLDRNAELESFFSSPMVQAADRETAIERWFRGRTSDLMVNSLQVLNGKDRLGLLRAVAEAFRIEHEDYHGQIDVFVRSAVVLSDAQRNRISEVAGAIAGKEARLVEQVDESLLGGLIMQVGDRKFDASVATQLKILGGALSDRASQEIHAGTQRYLDSRD